MKKISLILTLIFIYGQNLHVLAAVAYDLDTQALQNTNASSVTYSHTASGSNRAILVYVDLTGTAQTVNGITYAGTSLSSLISIDNITGGIEGRLEVFGLASSASGANNVVVTLSAANSGWDASAISFTGADQTTANAFTGASCAKTQGASNSTLSVTITTGKTDDMVSDGTCSTANNGTTSGAGQTQQWQDNAGTSNTQGSTKAGGASVVMTENWDAASEGFSLCAVNVVQISANNIRSILRSGTIRSGMMR